MIWVAEAIEWRAAGPPAAGGERIRENSQAHDPAPGFPGPAQLRCVPSAAPSPWLWRQCRCRTRPPGEQQTINHKVYPLLFSQADADELVAMVRQLNAVAHLEQLDEIAVRNLAYTARGDLAPVNAFIGGLAAHEVIKVSLTPAPLAECFCSAAVFSTPLFPCRHAVGNSHLCSSGSILMHSSAFLKMGLRGLSTRAQQYELMLSFRTRSHFWSTVQPPLGSTWHFPSSLTERDEVRRADCRLWVCLPGEACRAEVFPGEARFGVSSNRGRPLQLNAEAMALWSSGVYDGPCRKRLGRRWHFLHSPRGVQGLVNTAKPFPLFPLNLLF